MSWLSKFILLIPLTLAGCGFQPLYGKHQPTSSPGMLAGVKVDTISGRMGQRFKADLEDRLNPSGAVPANPAYRLSATLTNASSPIGVARDGTISRYNVYLESTYVLTRISDGKQITKGSLRHVSSFSNLANEYFSTFVSEEDAIKRGVTELSEMYRQRLATYLSGQ